MKKRIKEEHPQRTRPLKKAYPNKPAFENARTEWRLEWQEKNKDKILTDQDVDSLPAEFLKRFLDSHGILVTGNTDVCRWRAKRFLKGETVRINVPAYVRTLKFPRTQLPYDVDYASKQGIHSVPYDLLASSVFKHMPFTSLVNMMCMSAHMYNMVLRFIIAKSKDDGMGTPMGVAAVGSFLAHRTSAHTMQTMLNIPRKYRSSHRSEPEYYVKNAVNEYGSVEAAVCVGECKARNKQGKCAEDEYVGKFVDERLATVHAYLDKIGFSIIRFKLEAQNPKTSNEEEEEEKFEKQHLVFVDGATANLCYYLERRIYNRLQQSLLEYIFMRRDRILENILAPLQHFPGYLVHILKRVQKTQRPLSDICINVMHTVSEHLWKMVEYSESTRVDMIYSFQNRLFSQNNIFVNHVPLDLYWMDKDTLKIQLRAEANHYHTYINKGQAAKCTIWINKMI